MHRSKCHLKNKLTNMQYRIKILFRVLMFGKPECDVFQPEPHSGEACNTLSHKSLTNVNIVKECYIDIVIYYRTFGVL